MSNCLRSRAPLLAVGLPLLAGLVGCGGLKGFGLTKKSSASVPAAASAADGTGDAFVCAVEKSPAEFMTTMVQDLFRRGPSADELAMGAAAAFDEAKAVDWAMTQQEFNSTGIAYFVSNLLRIEENLKPTNPKDPVEVALIADLKQEPVVLVQRNADKPWAHLFTTQEFFCTAKTGPLYGYPVDASVSGFVSCKMEPERAGLLGLVSILRAYSSAFYTQNNNYHRNALAVYLAQGLQLAAKTSGPTGTGRPQPLPACVPEVDTRRAKGGLVFGTAAIPQSGPICASCHVPYHAEMVSGFLRFGPDGAILQLADVDKLQDQDTLGISKDILKEILANSGTSCWSANGATEPPEVYEGLPGLGRLIATSPKLGRALGIQLQQNWMNTNPVEAATAASAAAFDANGGTLMAALKGYLLSDPYRCSKRANP